MAQNVFKLSDAGLKFIKQGYNTKLYMYNLDHAKPPDDAEFMNKVRVTKELTADGIKFTVDVTRFDMFVLQQDDVMFALYNTSNFKYIKNTNYTSIYITLNKTKYFLDPNHIVGIVKDLKKVQEVKFWKEISDIMYPYLSLSYLDDNATLSTFPAKAVSPKTAKAAKAANTAKPVSAKAASPTNATKAVSPANTAKATSPKAASPANAAKATSPKTAKATSPKTAKATSPKAAKATSPKTAKATSPKTAKATSPKAASPANTAKVASPRQSFKIQKHLPKKAYMEHDKQLQSLSKDDCHNIISSLKSGNDKVPNPKFLVNSRHTSQKINFDSDIVLTALSKCYFDTNLDVKDVSELIDVTKLYHPLNANVDTTRSTRSTKTKQLRDIMDPTIVEDYHQSCLILAAKRNLYMYMPEYQEHIKKLLRILDAIYKHYIKTYTSAVISFNLLDEQSKENIISFVDKKFVTEKPYMLKELTFDDTRPVRTLDDVVTNTYLKRVLNFLFSSGNGNGNIKFNYTNLHNKYDSNFEYQKYMSVLPKYHCLNFAQKLKKNDIQELLQMLQELDEFTKPFPKRYTIYGMFKPIHNNLSLQISKYIDNIFDKNKLLFVIINNNFHKKPSADDYYYYFEHDGPAPASSFIGAENYIKFLSLYQPLDIRTDVLQNIETYYKGVSPLFSKVVNEALQNHILNGIKLNENTTRKLENVMQYVSALPRRKYDREVIYVFHGTQNLMHAKGQTEMNLISFLSCSFNIYISIDYAINNFAVQKKYKKGIIYVFEIDKDVNYINFNDSLFQILLLPGTKIIIRTEFNVGSLKYILCHVSNNNNMQFGTQLLEDIKHNTSLLTTTYTIHKFQFRTKPSHPKSFQVSFSRNTLFKDNVPNMFTMNIENSQYIYTSLGNPNNSDSHRFSNLQYTIHQHIINDCYRYFNERNCIEYTLLYEDDKIYTAWKVDADYDTANTYFKYNLENFFIDSLMGYTDCMNKKNYLMHKVNQKNMMISFKGCGLYNTAGYRKPRFNRNEEPFEYLSIFTEIIDQSLLDTNMNQVQLMAVLKFNKFMSFNEDFAAYLSQLHDKYKAFLNCLDIAHDSPEYIDLYNMIDDIIHILHIRSAYFQEKTDVILSNIMKCMNDSIPVLSGGKHELLKTKSHMEQLIKPKTSSKHLSNLYDSIKNLPLPSDTQVVASELTEPYKSYYKTKSDADLVDTFNEGYCVSNEEFAKILYKLNKSMHMSPNKSDRLL